jgi:hypothetical protein
MWKKWKLCLLLPSLLLLNACDQNSATSKVVGQKRNGVLRMKLSESPSGYVGSPQAYREFFSCWQSERDAHLVAIRRAIPVRPPQVIDATAFDLPQSYRDFLIGGGLNFVRFLEIPYEGNVSGFSTTFVPLLKVRPFSANSPRDLKIWTNTPMELSDDGYYRYDRSQNMGGFRSRQLADMLVVGTEGNGGFHLLNPAEKSQDGEWETLLLHPKIPGAIRFKSFAHFVVQLYLEDRVEFTKSSGDEGYLYFFSGDLSRTCARHIISTKPM